MDVNYEHMSAGEIIAYYQRVKEYIEQGFRVEGLKDELHLILKTLKDKQMEFNDDEFEQYLLEIDQYLKNIRH